VRLYSRLVVAVLIYITLDLSLASMPGAFVFDVDDSVESVQIHRTRDVASSMTALAFTRDPRNIVVFREVAPKQDVIAMPLLPRMPLRTGARRPSATPELPPPSEDSH
jgi:hypothetical protein